MGLFDAGNPLGNALASLMGTPAAAATYPPPGPPAGGPPSYALNQIPGQASGPPNYATDPAFTGDPDSNFQGPPAPTFEQQQAAQQSAAAPPMPGPAAPPPGNGFPPAQSLEGAVAPPPPPPPAAPPPQAAVPMPPPRPAMPPPPVVSTNPTGPVAPSAPQQAAVAPAPPPSAGRTWLQNALGGDARMARQIGGSLGEGLKAVGTNWNKPGLAAFAGTAGSAIQGGQAADTQLLKEKESALDRKLKSESQEDRRRYDRARIDVQLQKLEEASKVGTVKTRADQWRNSDLGKIEEADREIGRQHEGIRKSMKKALEDPDEDKQNLAQEKLASERKRIEKEVYERRGIDPDAAAKAKLRGTPFKKPDGTIDLDQTKQNAHKPTSVEQFHNEVKQGDYYINPANGHLMRRKDPAPPPVQDPRENTTPSARPTITAKNEEDEDEEAA